MQQPLRSFTASHLSYGRGDEMQQLQAPTMAAGITSEQIQKVCMGASVVLCD
jgi:hypothetical protein